MEETSCYESACSKVRRSCKAVTDTAQHVKIVPSKLQELAQHICDTEFSYVSWEDCHFKITESIATEHIIAYVFVIDALNFCFWPTPSFEYDHLQRNLTKLLMEEPDFFLCENLSEVTVDTVKTRIL